MKELKNKIFNLISCMRVFCHGKLELIRKYIYGAVAIVLKQFINYKNLLIKYDFKIIFFLFFISYIFVVLCWYWYGMVWVILILFFHSVIWEIICNYLFFNDKYKYEFFEYCFILSLTLMVILILYGLQTTVFLYWWGYLIIGEIFLVWLRIVQLK